MRIVTSLSFNGQCREAFEFYAEVLGGEIKAAITYGDAPPEMQMSDEKYRSWLMHCWLEAGDQALMGADLVEQWAPNIGKPKNGFDVTLMADDLATAERWFGRLSEGGRVIMPLGPTFWSPGFGSFVDRYGIPWMISTSAPEGWQAPPA